MGKQDKTERGKTQLARLRKARGLTQTEIAYDLGVSKATYSSWESGRIELGGRAYHRPGRTPLLHAQRHPRVCLRPRA